MILEHIKRKFIITTLALIIFIMTMSFPSVEKNIEHITISYTSGDLQPVYVLNKSSYVSRIQMSVQKQDTLEDAKDLIEILTIHSGKSAYIPGTFQPIIPEATKILSIDMQENVLKINFSKELWNIPKDYEEKMLECIVYTLTELENVKGVILFVEGTLIEKLPSSSTPLPPILTRDLGVNKTYNITSLKNVSKTTIYYNAKEENMNYYVPVTLLENSEKNKVEIIIERLKSMPNEKTNLMSYLNASTELTNYELLEEEIKLSFAPLLYEGLASNEILEEVKYSISLSMKDSLNIQNVIFLE